MLLLTWELRDSMACAIREAYAATLTVVILVDDRLHGDDGNEA